MSLNLNWMPNLPMPSLPAGLQDGIAKLTASAATNILEFEKKEIALERHPLQTVYHLVRVAKQGEEIPDFQKTLKAVPKKLRNAIFYEVWFQSTDPRKGGHKWGKYHALDDHSLFLNATKSVIDKTLHDRPQGAKNEIFGSIYRMAGQPPTFDTKWGENHASGDTERLIRALHRHHCLEIPGKEVSVYSNPDMKNTTPSCCFHLYRKELDRGQIGFQNGMNASLEHAKADAIRISNDSARGYNIHSTYSSTFGLKGDFSSALLGQGGIITPAVIQLLDQWQDFAETHENQHLLQICYSRGCIEVHNALVEAPKELQQRIIVIAIGPATLIPPELAYKAINLVIPADPVVKVATNRHLLDTPSTRFLKEHNDTKNHHDLHGSSYREQLCTMIDCYIHINDI